MKFSISGRHTSNYDSHDRSDEANCGDGAHTLFVTLFWNCQLFYNVIVVIRRRIIVPVIICLLMISEPHRPCVCARSLAHRARASAALGAVGR